MSSENPFKKLENITDPELIVTSHLEEAANAYFDKNKPDLAFYLQQLPKNDNVLRFQILRTPRSKEGPVIEPPEEITARIQESTLDALLINYPEYTWELSLYYDGDVRNGFIIYVDLNALQEVDE